MRFSLRKKTIILVMCIVFMTSLLAIVILNIRIHNVIETQFKNRSVDIANLVSLEVDAKRVANVQKAVREIYYSIDNKVMSDKWDTPEFDEYISHFSAIEETEDFKVIRDDLRKMQDVLDVNCLYLVWLDTENDCYIYLVDADEYEPCPTGCIDPVYLENAEALINPSVGLPPNITNTPEYGWLISTGMPVFDDQGEVLAYSTVDISMEAVMEQQNSFLLYSVLAFLALAVLVCVIGIWLVSRIIVHPINTLSNAAEQYVHSKNAFSNLKMDRTDEIGILANSMTRMESEIGDYIKNLEKTTNDLISAREHADQMDRIANIDALTKVRNKRAYDIEVERLNKSTQPYGIVMIDLNGLKKINDTYGHEKGDISIKTVCRIICQTFRYSPVFRIGGDEFIVLLENSDYEERLFLIQSAIESFHQFSDNNILQPWERVTAAVGYAIFDPATDKCVQDVQQRADKAMYEQKRASKK